MPNPTPELLIFEPFIETDEVIVSSKSSEKLSWKGSRRWVEITVGVIGKHGSMCSLSPSLTVKESGDILSLEEKFQGMYYSHLFFLFFSIKIMRVLTSLYNRRHWHKSHSTSNNDHEVCLHTPVLSRNSFVILLRHGVD